MWKHYALSWSRHLDLEPGSCISSVLAAVTEHLKKETEGQVYWTHSSGTQCVTAGGHLSRSLEQLVTAETSRQEAESWRLALSCLFPLCSTQEGSASWCIHSHIGSVFSPQLMGSRNTDKPSCLFPWRFPIPWGCQSRLTITGLSEVTKVLYNPRCAQSSDHRSQQPLNQKGTIVPTPPCVTKPRCLAGEVYYILHYILHLHLRILTLHWISPYKK